MKVSDGVLYNTARAVVLAVTGREYNNYDISDEQYASLMVIMRSFTNHIEFCAKQQ